LPVFLTADHLNGVVTFNFAAQEIVLSEIGILWLFEETDGSQTKELCISDRISAIDRV
jgi:hypothetical protein